MNQRADIEAVRKLVFGSRRSKLALWQTRHVVENLVRAFPGLTCEIVEINTAGDRNIDQPLPEIGGKGLFTAELDQAIRRRQINIAIHSLKDLPTESEPGISIAPVLRREDPRDVLISRSGHSFDELAPGSVVGTSSPRRSSQLLALRGDLEVRSIRGNVPTRIAKVEKGDYDAVVLAAAGVIRVGLENQIVQWFASDIVMPAPGQGCIAATFRSDDETIKSMLESITDHETSWCVAAERYLLSFLGGGCSAPIAAFANVTDSKQISLSGRISMLDGSKSVTKSKTGGDPESAARELAAAMLADGGAQILESIRRPLAGKRIVVTRAAEQSGLMFGRLRELGAEPLEMPLIKFSRLATSENSQEILNQLSQFDWIIFTSVNAIRIFFDLLSDPTQLDGVKIACVGRKSAEVMAACCRPADFVPERYTSDTLAAQIELTAGERVLLPGPRVTRPRFLESLRAQNATVTQWALYETIPVEIGADRIAELRAGIDAVTFASPSVVDSFCRQLIDYREILQSSVVACIGTTTSRRARELGVRVDIVPEEFTIPSLVESLARYSKWKRQS